MIVKTLWATRSDLEDSPELLVAWDDNRYGSWPEGFDAECEKQLAAMEDDLVQWRVIDIKTHYDNITQCFLVPQISSKTELST